MDAAGVAIQARDTGRVLLLRRTDGRWDLPGGGAEARDRTSLVTAMRELIEETGYRGSLDLEDDELTFYEDPSGSDERYLWATVPPESYRTRYVAYRGSVPREFRPEFDGEHDAHGWFSADDLAWGTGAVVEGLPIHEGVQVVLFTFYARFA